MLNLQQYNQVHPTQHTFDQDDTRLRRFGPCAMASYPNYDSTNSATDMFAIEHQEYKYDMMRAVSQTHAEAAPSLLSSTSVPSLPSASSSVVGSPCSGHAQLSNSYLYTNQYFSQPTSIYDDAFPYGFEPAHFEMPNDKMMAAPFIDSALISGQQTSFLQAPFGGYQTPQQQQHYSPAPSPAPSSHSYQSFCAPVTVDNFGQRHSAVRRPSITSLKSGASPQSSCSDEDSRDKGRCPYPDCGRVFKDLKAHMMTHETVRPEKCPIVSCEYNRKGFARKYDKNRHTLTHYRGTMVCGFCPGSGSAAERSFNRADVFKKHLTLVHGVEQTPPNSRKRSPVKATIKLSSYCSDATGKCSTCSSTFNNAQDFYEHLDDCVLRVVQQLDPTESINAQCLAEVANDHEVLATFERNQIKAEDCLPSFAEADGEEEDDEDDEDDEDEDSFYNERSGRGIIRSTKVTSNRPIIGGNISKRCSKKGLTRSTGGGSIIGKSRKRRKFYPPSWGMATDKMNMKKRVLCVYDGQRRLLKDDMMMHNEFEVRMPLLDSNSYVTDLDMETMKRAEAFHNMSPEDKGPWIPTQDYLPELLP